MIIKILACGNYCAMECFTYNIGFSLMADALLSRTLSIIPINTAF